MEIVVDILNQNEMDENAIFLRCENENDGILVDPGLGENSIKKFLENNNYNVKYVLITHAHFDHIASAEYFREKYGCDIYVHEKDKDMMEDPIKNESSSFGPSLLIKNTKTYKDGDILDMCNIKIKCIHTPGHTPGSSCFYIEEKGLLLSGDTLFYMSYGRTDFYGGSQDDIERSLKDILFKLPDNVKVIPGHGEITDIGKEKKYNMIWEF